MGNGDNKWEVKWEASEGAVGSGNNERKVSEGVVGNGHKQVKLLLVTARMRTMRGIRAKAP